MKISRESVKYIAHLARIELAENEIDEMSKYMETILSYVDKLNEVNTCDVKPTEHIIPLRNVFREDDTGTSTSREELLSNAPSKEKGYVKVPSTF